MKKLRDLFFSMKSMGILILIFAFSIGTATFIEKDFGTPAAKALVYNATWFNILLALLAANLVGNIFRYHMYRRGKFTIFLFHAAFLVILLGAAITRFTGFEGILHLREGQTSNTILSDQTYVEVHYQRKANGPNQKTRTPLCPNTPCLSSKNKSRQQKP